MFCRDETGVPSINDVKSGDFFWSGDKACPGIDVIGEDIDVGVFPPLAALPYILSDCSLAAYRGEMQF